MTGLAQGIRTPWPMVDFDRENPPEILSFYVYVNSDRGQDFLLRPSFAVLGAPQANWALLQSRADLEARWQSRGGSPPARAARSIAAGNVRVTSPVTCRSGRAAGDGPRMPPRHCWRSVLFLRNLQSRTTEV